MSDVGQRHRCRWRHADGDEPRRHGVERHGRRSQGDGTVTYTPDADFNGTDIFTYTVSDGNGGSSTATVSVDVDPVDDAPVAPDVSGPVDEDDILTGTIAATDVDNDDTAITYQVNTAVAGFTLNPNGDWSLMRAMQPTRVWRQARPKLSALATPRPRTARPTTAPSPSP